MDEDADGKVRVTVYDVEMENRPSDREQLPKRLRYYNSLVDTRLLESGTEYDMLPDFISITILSYDPFGAGDMYYEASTSLTTHPNIEYDDGISHIFLYCSGKVNAPLTPTHGKRLMEVLKYIVSGEKPCVSNPEVDNLETVVSKIKTRAEVTKKYMQQWDRERILVQEAKEEGRTEGRTEGKTEGKDTTLIEQICKKILKGKDSATIASEIEEDNEDFVREICAIAEKYMPDYDVDQIYEEWKSKV